MVEIYSKFLWTGNPKDSDVWFIWNEEMFWNRENAEKKFKKYKLDSESIEYKFWEYFTKAFFECHKKKEAENPNEIWKAIKELSWFDIDKVFIGEFYFLPSRLGNGRVLKETYGWKLSESKYTIKWEPYYDRECFYEANGLMGLLNERVENIFEMIRECKPKVVVFYWNDALKMRYIKKLADDPILKSDYSEIQTSDYFWRYFIITPFLDEEFIKKSVVYKQIPRKMARIREINEEIKIS